MYMCVRVCYTLHKSTLYKEGYICPQVLNHEVYLQTLSYPKSLEYGIDLIDYPENSYR